MNAFNMDSYRVWTKRLFGGKLELLSSFFDVYKTIRERRGMLENGKVGYVYDDEKNEKISPLDGLILFYEIESERAKYIIDLAEFIDVYEDMPSKIRLVEASDRLMEKLLGCDKIVELQLYIEKFPKHIFALEVEKKINYLIRAQQPEWIRSISNLSQEEKENIVSEVDKEWENTLETVGLSGMDNNQDVSSEDIIKYLNEMRAKLKTADLEYVLDSALESLPDLMIDIKYQDALIVISMKFQKYKYKVMTGVYDVSQEDQVFSVLISSVLELFRDIRKAYAI